VPPGPRNRASSRRASGQIKDEATVHFGVELEVEVIQRFLRIAKPGLFAAALQQSVGATVEFVVDEAGNQINGRHRFGLCLMKAGFQDGRYAAEAELP